MGSKKEQSNIAIAILKKKLFYSEPNIIQYFGGTNNIFADCNVFRYEFGFRSIKDIEFYLTYDIQKYLYEY